MESYGGAAFCPIWELLNGLGTVLFMEVEKSEMERHERSALFHFLEFITWQILGSKIIVQGNEFGETQIFREISSNVYVVAVCSD